MSVPPFYGVRRSVSAWALVAAAVCAACGANRPLWHDQLLPSGKTVKVMSFNLVWGIEHDDRDVTRDCLALEFVSSDPAAAPAAQEREAWDVFELIRPASELWRFTTANVSVFPTLERKGRRVVYVFTRGADGKWTTARSEF